MTHSVAGNTLILSGEVVHADLERVTRTLESRKDISNVVLRNSMGGNSWTGYRLGELFRARAIKTAVSGYCVSACSRLFLGGIERQFSDDFPASMTYVGFHGHYDFGKLNPAAVEKNDQIGWTLRFTDQRVNPALVKRWAAIPIRAGDVRFYPSGANAALGAETFYCAGTESRRPHTCERLATDAVREGIVTSRVLFASPDASSLAFKQREREFATSGYAAFGDRKAQALRSASVAREYAAFVKADLPKAFAISSDLRVSAWRAKNKSSAVDALAACRAIAKRACTLYAVDERVVYRADAATLAR